MQALLADSTPATTIAADARPAGAATAFPDATDAALEILAAGGNAVDAAVAAAWALAVCEPAASGLGGQTTLLIYRADGSVLIIDGHSHGPASASLETVSPREQRIGHRACVIPSTPATLEYARRRYGVLAAHRVLRPAIRLAENGYAVTPLQQRQTEWVLGHLRASAATRDQFLVDGRTPPVGHRLRQPRLARTLRRLRDYGADDFYRGEIARAISEDMSSHGGLITREDLAAFALPVERQPLRASYRGLEVLSTPPPGGGLSLLVALKVLEQFLPGGPRTDADWYDAVARATYAGFRAREESSLRDGDFTQDERDRFLAAGRVEMLAARFADGPRGGGARPAAEDAGDTTHLTVSDHAGNVVALTQSIQSVFGAKVANPEMGFVYNNYLATCPRSQHPNRLSSRCLPRSNAAPALVLGGGSGARSPLLALGAAGSRRIVSAVLQVISSVVDLGRAVDEAVAAPRVHALLGGEVWLEEPAASPGLLALLESHFRSVRRRPALSYKLGAVQALQWLPDGTLLGAADPRRDGASSVAAREPSSEDGRGTT